METGAQPVMLGLAKERKWEILSWKIIMFSQTITISNNRKLQFIKKARNNAHHGRVLRKILCFL